MPEIGPLELLVVAFIALIVLGPQKLPQYARTAGRWMTEMRRMATEVRDEFKSGLEIDDDDVADEQPGDAYLKDRSNGHSVDGADTATAALSTEPVAADDGTTVPLPTDPPAEPRRSSED